MFYDGWFGLVRVLVVGSCAYLALIASLRISGKRTLAKLNAFDFIVTVALGSTLATVSLSSTVALVEGLTAFAMLIALQALVAAASARSRRVERLVKSEPTLVYRDGFLPGAMRRERLTPDELRQAARGQGYPDVAEIRAIVLETDGTLSLLTDPPALSSERENAGPSPGGAKAADDSDEADLT